MCRYQSLRDPATRSQWPSIPLPPRLRRTLLTSRPNSPPSPAAGDAHDLPGFGPRVVRSCAAARETWHGQVHREDLTGSRRRSPICRPWFLGSLTTVGVSMWAEPTRGDACSGPTPENRAGAPAPGNTAA